MKKFFLPILFVLALIPFRVFAADWLMQSFHADITVGKDGIVDVVETIQADFLIPKHGIFRYVPIRGTDTEGKSFSLDARLENVTDEKGVAYHVSESKEDGNVVWKVGDADRTLTGEKTYVIRYRVIDPIGRFEDHDELYWNVSGTGWDVPLPIVMATVHLPSEVTPVMVQTTCYTGPYGSKANDCEALRDPIVQFTTKHADEGLTIVVGWPKGIVAKPPFSLLGLIVGITWWFGPLVLFVIVLVVLYRRWKKFGADKPLGTLVVQYEPPDNLSPAETLALLKQRSTTQGGLAPTIVDLAVRGYLSIHENAGRGIMGTSLGASTQYSLKMEKTKEEWKSAKPFEQELLKNLFNDGAVQERNISDLKEKFYKHATEFTKNVMSSLTDQGYFVLNPTKVRTTYFVVAVILAFLTFWVFLWPTLAVAMGLSAIATALFGVYMPKWSDKGHAAAAHARGFKEFIDKVEKYRAPWMEQQNIFEKILPYALVFGLGTKWAKAFAGLNIQPPSWYSGGTMNNWNSMLFIQSMNNWSSNFTSIAVSSPAQTGSGSGFGGGGFSGGGGGGGGGGSW